jgi:hypothetical protein
MRCPTLHELPAAPPGRTGWPWTETSASLPPTSPNGEAWPRISIITPSFNQERFLEGTIRSVLLQGYPNLEYRVLDGGSSDGSVAIIQKYAAWLTHWISEKDGGQSAAINRGLRASSGAFAAWINSDDLLCRNALVTLATRASFQSRDVYIGDCVYVDENQQPLSVHRGRVHDFDDLVNITSIWRARGQRGHIVQPEVLFPLQLALDVGGLDPLNHRTMDYELWGKFLLAGAVFRYTEIPFGMFRLHADQKTADGWAQTQALVGTAEKLVGCAQHLADDRRQKILADLRRYQDDVWLETGVLARLRLPPRMVLPVRAINAALRKRASPLVRRVRGFTEHRRSG